MTKVMIAVGVLAAGCHNERPRSTIGARAATEFWCASNGECFTSLDACNAFGQCLRAPTAWCSQGTMGGDRFICATDKARCAELTLASREQFNNVCTEQPEGR